MNMSKTNLLWRRRHSLSYHATFAIHPWRRIKSATDLLGILEKREAVKAEEVTRTVEPDLELDAHVGLLLANQFKDSWIYLLPDEQWYEYKNQQWDSPPGWAYEILNRIEEEIKLVGTGFTRPQKKRMSSQQFIKSVEERLRRLQDRFCLAPSACQAIC